MIVRPGTAASRRPTGTECIDHAAKSGFMAEAFHRPAMAVQWRGRSCKLFVTEGV